MVCLNAGLALGWEERFASLTKQPLQLLFWIIRISASKNWNVFSCGCVWFTSWIFLCVHMHNVLYFLIDTCIPCANSLLKWCLPYSKGTILTWCSLFRSLHPFPKPFACVAAGISSFSEAKYWHRALGLMDEAQGTGLQILGESMTCKVSKAVFFWVNLTHFRFKIT